MMSVLFIQSTPQGELGRRLKDVVTMISPMLGFGVKIVERNSSALRNQFPFGRGSIVGEMSS